MFFQGLLLGKFLLSLFFLSAQAAGTWCILYPDTPPCTGLPGVCTLNADGSKGGFVADTAYVEKTNYFFFKKNKPFIGKYAQVCENAQILDEAKVDGFAVISGEAVISGKAEVFEYARVYGNARIGGTTQVYLNAKVHGNAWLDQGEIFKGEVFEGWISQEKDKYEFFHSTEYQDTDKESNFEFFLRLTPDDRKTLITF